MKKQFFIAPDNGVLTLLFNEGKITSLIRITNSKYFLASVSHTFHGRDIIAPVGAHIAQGVELRQLGDKLAPTDAVRFPNIRARKTKDGKITGKIVAVDHFGNLISNIEIEMLLRDASAGKTSRPLIQVGSHTIQGIDRTYANGQTNKPLALIGSRGYLEIAVPGGNAAQLLKAGQGDRSAGFGHVLSLLHYQFRGKPVNPGRSGKPGD